MKLLYTKTHEEFEAEISLATEDDLRKIHNSEEFEFDWYAERMFPIYVIKRKFTVNAKVLGVMSLQDVKEEYRLHISLIESSKSNRGKIKKIDHIVGCLIAYAVKISFDERYNGFVSLEPKTEIITWYQVKYNFRQYGRYLGIEGLIGLNLMKKYDV